MRAVAALLLLASSSTLVSAQFNIPDGLNFQKALEDHLKSLTPQQAQRVYKEQARLRSLTPDYDKLERTWPGAKDLSKPSPKPGQWFAKKDEEEVKDYERELMLDEEMERLMEQVKREEAHAQRQEKRQIGTANCAGWNTELAPNLDPKKATKCLNTTPVEKIDDPQIGLKVGTVSEWADGKIPSTLRGLFYMEGNPLPSDVFSTGTAYWNSTVGVWEMPAWAPGTWASTKGYLGTKEGLGRTEHILFRLLGVSYRNRCATGIIDGQTPKDFDGKNAQPGGSKIVCRTDQFLTRLNFPLSFGQYWDYEVEPDYHVRTTLIRIFRLPDGTWFRWNYNLWRIVDENGKRTKYFEEKYIANKGRFFGTNNIPFVHVKDTTFVPL